MQILKLQFFCRISDNYPRIKHNFMATSWSIENGYNPINNNVSPEKTYPFRIYGTGAGTGLSIILQINESNSDYMCTGCVSGYKVLLHAPGEVPQLSKYFFRVPLLSDVSVWVKPNVMTTTKSLKKYRPEMLVY